MHGTQTAPVSVSPQLQLEGKGMPCQNHKLHGRSEQPDTSLSIPTRLHLRLRCTPRLGKSFPLTSQAAAVGRIYFSAIYSESPAPGDVNVGCFFDIDYVRGSGAWDAKKVGDISAIEASLKQRESKFYNTSLPRESNDSFPHLSVPHNNSWAQLL